jgi:hypothetical protein
MNEDDPAELRASALRQRAIALIDDDQQAALSIARSIDVSWYACQALAWIGRRWSGREWTQILDEAARRGDSVEDPYQQASSAAWPIQAFLEREPESIAAGRLLRQALARSNKIGNLGSRSEALFTLFQATLPHGESRWRPVLDALIVASEPLVNWRQRRNLRDALQMTATHHPDSAEDLAGRIADPNLRTYVRRRLISDGKVIPRPFFW